MATHLLDTSVCSQPFKKHPVMTALRRWQDLGDDRCTTTVVCMAEIEWGLHKLSSQRHWQIYRGVLQPGLLRRQLAPRLRRLRRRGPLLLHVCLHGRADGALG